MSYRPDLMKLVFRALGEGSEERGRLWLRERSHTEACSALAMMINDAYGFQVTRQNVEYWVKVVQTNKAFTDRDMPADVKPVPVPTVCDTEEFDSERVYKNILVLGDDHEPYGHPDKIAFLKFIVAHVKPDLVIHLGDEVDHHAMSMHDSDPNLDSASVELYKARERMAELAKLFPKMLLCNSNHGSMAYRRALKHGIPVEYIKSYIDILFPDKATQPDWKWADEWKVNTPLGQFVARHQFAGNPVTAACHEGLNVVYGHFHSEMRVVYKQSGNRLYWGANPGCLADPKSLAFKYNVNMKDRPALGCMVIVAGTPMLMPMRLDGDKRFYHRGK